MMQRKRQQNSCSSQLIRRTGRGQRSFQRRRNFWTVPVAAHSLRDKLRILADRAAGVPGAVGAIVRREGLYSLVLSDWRRQRAESATAAFLRQKSSVAGSGAWRLEVHS